MRKNLPILTGIRFFAAFYVFIFHIYIRVDLDFLNPNILSIINQGAVGVNIFFILSGFILFYNYYNRKFNFLEFIFKRLAKIYPVYLAGFFICFLVTKITHEKIDSFFEIMMMNLLMIQSYLPKFAQAWYGGGSWSISTEFFFYLCFPLLLNFISKLSKNNLFLLLTICFLLSISPGILYNLDVINFRLSYAFPPSRVWEFIIGMVVASLVCKFNVRINNVLIYTIVFLSILFFYSIGRNLLGYVIQNIIVVPLMILILIGTTTGKRSFLSFLGNTFFEYLGKISYSFYIIQIPIMMFIDEKINLKQYNSLSSLLIILLFNLLGAMLLYHVVELPSHKFLNKKIKQIFIQEKPVLA